MFSPYDIVKCLFCLLSGLHSVMMEDIALQTMEK